MAPADPDPVEQLYSKSLSAAELFVISRVRS
jgi:hypothetical protein